MWWENQPKTKKPSWFGRQRLEAVKLNGALGCATLRLPDSRNDAKLLHHAQSIPANMVVQDFSVRDASHALHGHCFVCGSYASQVAFVHT